MNAAASILIFDPSNESAEVLSTLLAREGFRSVVVNRAEQASRAIAENAPELLVVDEEGLRQEKEEALRSLRDTALRNATPIVVLGTKRGKSHLAQAGNFVRKPYHYGPLLHRICESVADRQRETRRAA